MRQYKNKEKLAFLSKPSVLKAVLVDLLMEADKELYGVVSGTMLDCVYLAGKLIGKVRNSYLQAEKREQVISRQITLEECIKDAYERQGSK